MKSLPAYPAGDGWTLKYALDGPAHLALTATASGDIHAIDVTAATTAAYAAGAYIWCSYVERGSGPATERHSVGRGAVSVLASPLAALAATHAAQMLVLIEAALVGRIPRGLETTNIDGQELQRIKFTDLRDLRDHYRREVAAERAAALAAAGAAPRRALGIRFDKAR